MTVRCWIGQHMSVSHLHSLHFVSFIHPFIHTQNRVRAQNVYELSIETAMASNVCVWAVRLFVRKQRQYRLLNNKKVNSFRLLSYVCEWMFCYFSLAKNSIFKWISNRIAAFVIVREVNTKKEWEKSLISIPNINDAKHWSIRACVKMRRWIVLGIRFIEHRKNEVAAAVAAKNRIIRCRQMEFIIWSKCTHTHARTRRVCERKTVLGRHEISHLHRCRSIIMHNQIIEIEQEPWGSEKKNQTNINRKSAAFDVCCRWTNVKPTIRLNCMLRTLSFIHISFDFEWNWMRLCLCGARMLVHAHSIPLFCSGRRTLHVVYDSWMSVRVCARV